MNFLLKNFEISNRILIPFVLEIKGLLKNTPEFQYVEKANGIVDPNATKSYISIENAGAHALREKYPMITVGRSAMEFFMPYIASQADSQDIFDDHKIFGESFQTNIHIQIETHSKVMSERIASYIFNYFRYNKYILRNYGITDVKFNYISSAIPTKNSDDETISIYQVGINAIAKVYEIMSLERNIADNLVDEFMLTVMPSAEELTEDGTSQSGGNDTSLSEINTRVSQLETDSNDHAVITLENMEPENPENENFWFDIINE